MKVRYGAGRKPRVEILPLIDIVFLLLVFFIYAMLSMAVHRGMPVALPTSGQVQVDKDRTLSVTVNADNAVFVNETPVPLDGLAAALTAASAGMKNPGVLLFADRALSYQSLFEVLDRIRAAGLSQISFQAEAEPAP